LHAAGARRPVLGQSAFARSGRGAAISDAQRAAAAAQRRAAERALPGQALYQAVRANPALRERWGDAKTRVAEAYARGELSAAELDAPAAGGAGGGGAAEGRAPRDRWGAVRVNVVESSEVARLLGRARGAVRGGDGSLRARTHDRIVANRLPVRYPAKNLFGQLPGPLSLVARFQELVQVSARPPARPRPRPRRLRPRRARSTHLAAASVARRAD
jgi:hypothetical protein